MFFGLLEARRAYTSACMNWYIFSFLCFPMVAEKKSVGALFSRCRIVVVYILGIYLVTDEIYLHFDNLRCRLIIFVSVYPRPGAAPWTSFGSLSHRPKAAPFAFRLAPECSLPGMNSRRGRRALVLCMAPMREHGAGGAFSAIFIDVVELATFVGGLTFTVRLVCAHSPNSPIGAALDASGAGVGCGATSAGAVLR